MEAYNQQAFKDYNDKALEKCVGCGRTFLPDRLVVHQRSCLKGKDGSGGSVAAAPGKRGGSPPPKPDKGLGSTNKGSSIKSPVKAEKPKEIKMPPGLICYICG